MGLPNKMLDGCYDCWTSFWAIFQLKVDFVWSSKYMAIFTQYSKEHLECVFFFKKKCMGILVEHSIKQNYLQNLHFLPHWGFFHVWSFHIITFVTKKVASLEILSLVLEMNHTLYSLPLTREGQTLPWFPFNVRGIRIIYHLHVDAVTRALGLEGITLLTLDHNVDLSIPGQHVDMRF